MDNNILPEPQLGPNEDCPKVMFSPSQPQLPKEPWATEFVNPIVVADGPSPSFSYRGECEFCEHPDARHRDVDAWIGRVKAGEDTREVANDFGIPVEWIEIAVIASIGDNGWDEKENIEDERDEQFIANKTLYKEKIVTDNNRLIGEWILDNIVELSYNYEQDDLSGVLYETAHAIIAKRYLYEPKDS